MNILTWDELDGAKTADEIAELLRAKGVRGYQSDGEMCPLAVATGEPNDGFCRAAPGELDSSETVQLTEAEMAFISAFDTGQYPDLDVEANIRQRSEKEKP